MPTATQQHRPVKVFTALDDDVLLFGSMSGTERLSTLFEYELTLVSESADVDPAALLGTDLTVELELPAGGVRHFHGHVADFGDAPRADGDLYAYTLSIRPWLWFLTRTADCRIFQDMSVPDIVREVTGDAGFSDIDDELTESYPPWNYCVQYRETDYAFVARLLEQEGIHYYFRHERGKHHLVLADGGSGHETFADYADVTLYPPDAMDRREHDHLTEWRIGRHLQPGVFAVGDFNYETPTDKLGAEKLSTISHVRSDFEMYDYPGEYTDKAQGEVRAKVLLEAAEARHEIARGSGSAQGLLAGHRFALNGSLRPRDNREYLVISSTCTFSHDLFRSGDDDALGFHCDVEASGTDRPWRPARTTPKPRVRGPQTAIVVGPAGQEIWTDKLGRVKLQFHWDRKGLSDENSSCWVRVSQLWAGKGWGAMHLPRIGHEVIVEFLEGDPDRPIITGRVYNGENGVPHPLPATATQSGIKSRSSKGGSGANFNEIRMEDKKGEEELYLHAERNERIVVENSKSETVGANESVSIGNDRSESVGRNETLAVGKDRERSVDGHEKITVGLTRTHFVGINEAITVGGAREVNVGGFHEKGVVGYDMINVGAYQDINILGYQHTSVGANHKLAVDGKRDTQIGKEDALVVGESRTSAIGDDDTLTVGKVLKLSAGDEILLEVGQSTLSMKSDGTIVLSGLDVTVKNSGAKVGLGKTGTLTVKGTFVKIN